jgi:hypothetical protein
MQPQDRNLHHSGGEYPTTTCEMDEMFSQTLEDSGLQLICCNIELWINVEGLAPRKPKKPSLPTTGKLPNFSPPLITSGYHDETQSCIVILSRTRAETASKLISVGCK